MAFQCNSTGYQFIGNPSNVYEVDLVTGILSPIKATLPFGADAIGFNPIDGLIYSVTSSSPYNILTIDENYNISTLPYPTGLPLQGYSVGAFDTNGYYYITDPSINKYYVIDYNVNHVTYGYLVDPTNGYTAQSGPNYGVQYSNVANINMSDWAWNTNDGYLYGITNGGTTIRKLNPITGVVTDISSIGVVAGQNYGSLFSYANGAIFAIGNNDGKVYRLQLDPSGLSGSAIPFSQSTASNINDGTSCLLANFLVDFGDAPDTSLGNSQGNYTTLLANNGPRHGIVNDLKLGVTVTSEFDAYQSINAIGDDLIQSIQDDGLTSPVEYKEGISLYNVEVTYTNNTGQDAYLYGWFDYNMNGIFELGEATNFGTPIAVPSSITNPQTITITFIVPGGGGLVEGDKTYLRLRITSDILVNTNTLTTEEDTKSRGPASDGEVEDYVVTVTKAPAFECKPTAYQVVRPQLISGGFGNSQFRSIDIVTGQVSIVNYDTGYDLNAIGYNILDNYIYGIADVGNTPEHLIRITSQGNVIDLGAIPNLTLTTGIDVGAFDNKGLYYIKRSGDSYYYTVDLRPGSVNYGQLVSPVSPYPLAVSPYYTNLNPAQTTGEDWTYNPVDGFLYAISGGQFIKINPATGAVTAVPTNVGSLPIDYGSMFSDANGYIYGISDSTGQIIRWSNVGGTMQGLLFSQSQASTLNDATSCINMTVLIDFGDAPDTSAGNGPNDYNTLLSNNGPRHAIVNNLKLGTFVTSENDAYQNATATGDDIPLSVQDDGVIYPLKPIVVGDKTYTLPLSYYNDTGNPAIIYGWIDFNRDGIFEIDEASYEVTVTSDTLNPRQANLIFDIPPGLTFTPGETTFIRTRITTSPLANNGVLATDQDGKSVGSAYDGEVEDYIVSFTQLNISGLVWYDANCNGIRETGELLAQNITVELYKVGAGILPIQTTTTDINGVYSFNNLESGEYYVKVILPNGYSYTLPNVGINDTVDSDVDKSTGQSVNFNLSSDNITEVIDAGLCKCNKISGKAFYDCNKDGILEDGEPYLCGVTITLTDSVGTVLTTSTDCEGYYEFNNVCPETYTVKGIAPPDMSFTTQNSISYYGSKADATTGEFQVTLTNADYIQGFIGFTGSETLDLKYCVGCINACINTNNSACQNGSCFLK